LKYSLDYGESERSGMAMPGYPAGYFSQLQAALGV
jgi:hypothetical protein